jgi:hypothetical protein
LRRVHGKKDVSGNKGRRSEREERERDVEGE